MQMHSDATSAVVIYYYNNKWFVVWVLRQTRTAHWAIADGLGLIPKDGPETRHHNFDLPPRGWLY